MARIFPPEHVTESMPQNAKEQTSTSVESPGPINSGPTPLAPGHSDNSTIDLAPAIAPGTMEALEME